MNAVLFLLVRIDTAGAKFPKSLMWANVFLGFLGGNNEGHME